MKYYLLDRLSDGTAFRFHHHVVEPSHTCDHHDYHPHYEIYYNYEGTPQEVIINNQTVMTTTPTVIFISPFSIHSMSVGGIESPFESQVFHFGESLMNQFSKELLPSDFEKSLSNVIFPLTKEENMRLLRILPFIQNPDNNILETKSAFLLFLNTLFHSVSKENRIHIGRADFYIGKILTYIYDNIQTISGVMELCDKFHVSKSKLDRDFRQAVGMSPHHVIVNCRLERAIDLITNTDKKMKEIAVECGFETEYYFFVFFKNHTGRKPSSYRKGKTE